MHRKTLLKRLAHGAVHNIPFPAMHNLVEGFGFMLLRVRGSHHIFGHPEIPELLNLQNVQGQAKPYQIRQFLRLVEIYNLQLEDSS